jgi:hypothetical protein
LKFFWKESEPTLTIEQVFECNLNAIIVMVPEIPLYESLLLSHLRHIPTLLELNRAINYSFSNFRLYMSFESVQEQVFLCLQFQL